MANDKTPLRTDALQHILARIREAAPQISADRDVPHDIVNDMAAQRLFRLLVPRSVGGEEIALPDYLAITQAIAHADGSVAWCFNQSNVLGTMASLMPEPLAKEIWSDPNAIACNGPPQGATATPVEGGYSLTGRWNFSSGSRHANWALALAKVGDAETRCFWFPKAQAEFIDVWQVNGLRGTGSFSFQAKDLFVPAERTYVEREPSTREKGPLYQIPRNLVFAAGFASVALGVARAAIDIVIDLAQKKAPQESTLLSEQPTVQRDVAMAEAAWRSCNAFLNESAGNLWHTLCETHELRMDDRIALRLAATHAIRQSADAVDIAYTICGATSIFESSPIQRRFQDAHAITQQIQGRLDHYDNVGRYLMGLEPTGRFF